MSAKAKIEGMITERVINAIEQAIKDAKDGKAVAPWQRPWHGSGTPVNFVSKKPYKGINVFLLAMMGFTRPYFGSYKQFAENHPEFDKWGKKGKRQVAMDKDGNALQIVKKGEKTIPVVFWKRLVFDHDKDTGEKLDKPKVVWMLRYYRVLNVDQIVTPPKRIPEAAEPREFSPIEAGEKILADMPNPPKLTHDELRAYYAPLEDRVNMPKKETFKGDEEYYCTAFHEFVHSTGHASRLERKGITEIGAFGKDPYAKEELVAEMGAVMLCNEAGITGTFDNSIAYLKGWLERLKDDTSLLISAGGQAQKATDFILDRKTDYDKEDEKEKASEKTKKDPTETTETKEEEPAEA